MPQNRSPAASTVNPTRTCVVRSASSAALRRPRRGGGLMSTAAPSTARQASAGPGTRRPDHAVCGEEGRVRSVVHHARPVSTTTTLRPWQTRALAEMASWSSGPFLISAAPGAGKTRPALEFARQELAARRAQSVVITCPTAPLTRQWALAASRIGLQLAPDAESPRPPRGFHGVAVTYARVAKSPAAWARTARGAALVVADEAHHLGEALAWGESFGRASRSEEHTSELQSR